MCVMNDSWPELFLLFLKGTSLLSSQRDFTLICLQSFFQATLTGCCSLLTLFLFFCAYWALSPVRVTLRDKTGRRRETEYQMH